MCNQNADPDLMAAVENQNLIELFYDNQVHVIGPICYGINNLGEEIILALQTIPIEEQNKVSIHKYILNNAYDCNVLTEKFKLRPIENTNYENEFYKIFAAIENVNKRISSIK